MASHDEFSDINQKLITILSDLLQTGDWEASLFLRTAHKKLSDLCQQAKEIAEQGGISPETSEYKPVEQRQGYIKVFVSMYQSDPHNMIKWENTLKSIKEYSINRPIYRNEEFIQEVIRSKQGSPNEAYVSILIKEGDIIPPYTGKVVADKFGHELLTVRDNSLQANNIIEFVHSGRKYIFYNGKLLLKSDIS